MNRSFEKTSKIKDDIRLSFIEHSDSTPELIFTLPGPKKLDAILFREHFPNTPIIGVENDKASFQVLAKDPYPVMPYFCSIHDYAQAKYPTLHHSIIFLDYLGWYDAKKLEDIKTFIKNENLVHPDKRALLGITFQKANRQGSDLTVEDVKGVWKDKENDGSLDNIYAKIHRIVSNYRPLTEYLECREYQNDGGVTMYFILLRI